MNPGFSFAAHFFRRWSTRALLGAMLLLVCQAARGAHRLAIFTEDKNLEALLTATLENCEILSRSDLPQGVAEAVLSNTPVALEGADLALILEKAGRETSVRLVSAPTAATMANWMAPPLPADELARWIVLRTEPFLSAVASSTAPRVSLLGLHFETDSPEHRAAERLTNLRLAAEFEAAGALVLERWRMKDLVFEKTLLPETSPFWTDATLVDGSLSRQEGEYLARIRLRSPTEPERRLSVTADTLEILAKNISTLALKNPLESPPRAPEESEAFFKETRWMLANGLPREAWQAAEAALALGGSGTELEMLRIKAAAMTAYPDDLRVMNGAYNVTAFPLPELPLRVAAATEAMSLVRDYLAKHNLAQPPGSWSLENPPTLGVQTLHTAMRVLRTAEDSGWAAENAPSAQALRSAIQRNIEFMKTAPLGHMKSRFFGCLAQFAGYWHETPAEAIAFYRAVLQQDFLPEISSWPKVLRGLLVDNNRPRPPFLIGELPKDGFPSTPGARLVPAPQSAASRDAWSSFLDEMARSPEPIVQADALALRWQSTVDLPARYALTAQAIDFLASNKTLLSGPHCGTLLREFRGPLQDLNESKGLAASQEKLVGIFLHFLESPDPLPPDLMAAISAPFYNDKSGSYEKQAKTLLRAIDTRSQWSGLSETDKTILSDSRSRLLREFPQLRVAETSPDDITVKKVWLASEHTPGPLQGHVGFDSEAAIWHQGSLWVLDTSGGRLWRIQPETGASEIISPTNAAETSSESELVAWGNRLVITTKEGVKVLDPDLSSWKDVKLPKAKYAIGVSGASLWAASGHRYEAGASEDNTATALFRVASDLSATLVGSSRRKPPENPLDETIFGKPFAIFPAAEDNAILGTNGESRLLLNSLTGQPPEHFNKVPAGSFQLSSHPGIIVQCLFRGGDRNRFTRAELFTPHGNELLLAHPTLGPKGKPRFGFPPSLDEFNAREFTAAWDGKTLTVLAWTSEGSPLGISKAILFRFDESGVRQAPLRFAKFEEEADGRKRYHDSRVFQFPWLDPKSLIPTDSGLVITGRGMPGFWFLPYADLAKSEP
jgi:hypothetical protein